MDKKIVIAMPEALLNEVDSFSSKENIGRNEWILNAIVGSVSSKRREEALMKLKQGYAEMAEMNSALSEEGIVADNEQLLTYELKLSESE